MNADMSEAGSIPSDSDRHSLFEACTREAYRIGGDERTAEYFFVRAQSSRVWFSEQGDVSIADMDIEDWCNAIAWSAPGVGRPPQQSGTNRRLGTTRSPESPQTLAGAHAVRSAGKQPRSGAKARRGGHNPTHD